MISFADKTILITGAAGGIGHALASKVLALGANVALSDVNLEALNAVHKELAKDNARVSIHTTDVSDAQSCEQTAQDVAARYGKIHHLVHSAGIYPEKMVADMTDAEWRRLMSINLDGTFYMCRAVIPYLADNSSIVNLASMAGHRGSYSHAHYSASKGAVTSLSKSLALELAPKTRVNIVSPGIIDTPMASSLLQQKGQALLDSTPLKRFGTADEVANVIMFLCSDLASFVNGETLHVNGGLYIV
ncbi:SDR family NAD(P)-dependent oxidoreductase [Pusillimonas sp. ANT_WB101]|uniref:SDR family NAD(P)-dependent oxidoreductase n=1 Tax=Pusillimonas sp. ANT_WB101 TaxID=2597356 RepID=UPI0011ED4474|nr:SDR family NAD(P)-dependent oxidoreductase [Pusillimonas sp. ANT_WB101]KAA0893021.1 SDR family oxidoreductase [Pusillimonas sp. ANT_WB101]